MWDGMTNWFSSFIEGGKEEEKDARGRDARRKRGRRGGGIIDRVFALKAETID
jgi:hypothetical protein